MKFEITTDYEKEQTGPGIGISYRSTPMKVDIYIYSRGFPEISTDLESPQIATHFKTVCGDLFEMERLGYFTKMSKKLYVRKLSLLETPIPSCLLRIYG